VPPSRAQETHVLQPDDELADNACTTRKERTDFSGGNFATKNGRSGEISPGSSSSGQKLPKAAKYDRPKARIARDQQVFTIKKAGYKG